MGYETTPLAATEYHSFFFFFTARICPFGQASRLPPLPGRTPKEIGGKGEEEGVYAHVRILRRARVCVTSVRLHSTPRLDTYVGVTKCYK